MSANPKFMTDLPLEFRASSSDYEFRSSGDHVTGGGLSYALERGYTDCSCSSCSGTFAEVAVDSARVAWRREERSMCGNACAPCASSAKESVELRHLRVAEGVSGCVVHWSRLTFALLAFAVAAILLLPFYAFVFHDYDEPGPDTGIFEVSDYIYSVLGPFGVIIIGPFLGLLALYFITTSCSTASRLHLKTDGDKRPFEEGGAMMMDLPNGGLARVWNNLRTAWVAQRSAAQSLQSRWSDDVHTGHATTYTSNEPLLQSADSLRVQLTPASYMRVSSSGLVELQETICCHRESRLTWTDSIKWARVPHGCDCCAELQLGAHREYTTATMLGEQSASTLTALERTMLQRAPAAATGPRAASFTAYSQDCGRFCSTTTITSDSDFVKITSPTNTVLIRTSDVPFVYYEKSAVRCYQALSTLVVFAAFAGVMFQVIYLEVNYYLFLDPLHFCALAVCAWFFAVALSASGVISCVSLLSCCCRFTSVTVGTLGASSGAGGKGAACCRICLCRCGRLSAQSKFYRCQDDGSVAAAFVERVRAHIDASVAADSGAPKMGAARD